MADTRKNFYNVLIEEVESKPSMKDTFNTLDFAKLTRYFDHMPCWLEDEKINQLAQEFKTIIQEMGVVNIMPDSEEKRVVSANFEHIDTMQQSIVKMACDDLLDATGRLKGEITDLLECNKTLSDKHVYALVAAYVSAVYQEIYFKNNALQSSRSEYIEDYFKYSKKNIFEMIVTEVKKRNKDFAPNINIDVHAENPVNRFLSTKFDRQTAIGVGAGVLGAGVLAGLAVAGALFFKSQSSQARDNGAQFSFNSNTLKF